MLKNDWTDGWGQGRDQRVAGLQGPLREDEIHEGQGGVLVAWTRGSVRDGSVLALRRVELP